MTFPCITEGTIVLKCFNHHGRAAKEECNQDYKEAYISTPEECIRLMYVCCLLCLLES